jgi:hypothetical protein
VARVGEAAAAMNRERQIKSASKPAAIKESATPVARPGVR